jgi:hypothetical protein
MNPVKVNLIRRRRLLRAARESAAVRWSLMQRCKSDIVFWMDHFCFQINPRQIGSEVGPWITHDFQRDAITRTRTWLADGEDVLWEKSRYLGATWMALLMEVHDALFFDYKKFLNISHTEAAVDAADDPDCLFWKVQFVLDHLPDWMRRGAGRQRRGVIRYPATKGTMTGAATTERAGVGGRATWVLADEFAKQKDDFAILGQTADTGPRLFVSTHYGIGSAWHSLTQRPDIKKVILHWSQHPEMNAGLYRSTDRGYEILDKSYPFPADYQFVTGGTPNGGPFPGIRSPWYDRECQRRKNDRDVAMHLDINPKGSQSQYFPESLIYSLRKKTSLWRWEGDLAYDAEAAKPFRLIDRVGGPLRLWLNPTVDGGVPKADYVFGCDPSHGRGATPTCVSIGRSATGEKVGEWVYAHLSVQDFAKYFVALARLFASAESSGAFLIWERQGPGEMLTQRVIETGYRNFYYRHLESGLVGERTESPGWFPSPEATKLLIDQYIAALADGTCTNPSDRALEQTLDFRYDSRGYPEHPGEKSKEDPSAGGVNHGDIVRADALMWKVMRDRGTPAPGVEPATATVGSFQWRRELRAQTARLQEQF